MKELTVDFKTLDNREKFYDYIAEEMDLPAWFGRNADALSDLLSCEDVHITVKNASSAGEWAAPILSVFTDLDCAEFSEEEALPPVEQRLQGEHPAPKAENQYDC